MRMGNTKTGRRALGMAAAAGVKHMAQRFIVGEDPKAALGDLRDLWKDGVASSVDLLGEATVTQAEAQRYADRCADALDTIAGAAAGWPAREQLERDSAGPLPRANLSVKVSALTPLLRPDAPERGKRDAADRLRPLLRRAHERGAHLHIDMESMDSRDAVLELILELLAEEEFRAGPSAGLVLQGYLRDSPDTLDTILAVARRAWRGPRAAADDPAGQGRLLGPRARPGRAARLVDAGLRAQGRHRRELRAAHAPPARRAAARYPRRDRVAQPALGRARDRLQPARPAARREDLELQVLRGLGDPLQTAIAAQGLRVRTYCPVGDLVAGMAYLVRRLLENTSNESFLYEQARGTPLEELLAAPA